MNSNPKFVKQVESITSDLRLIRQVTKPGYQERICPPKNLNELSNLLKKKNMGMLISRDQKQKGQQWLHNKGVDVSPLIQKIKLVKEQSTKQQVIKKKQEDCYFYIPQINETKQEEYLNKAVQFSALGLLQRTMSSRDFRRDFTRRMLNKLRGVNNSEEYKVSNKEDFGKMIHISTQYRSETKKNQYIKGVEKMFKNKFQQDWLAEELANTIQSKLWKIVHAHTQARTQGQSQGYNMMEMLIESLHMVEKQYDQKLPNNVQSLNYYLSNHYIEKMSHQDFIRDGQHGSFYGKLFLLYRAGRKAQFYNLLSTKSQFQLIDKFHKAQISISKKDPLAFDHKNTAKDVFLDQLIYALKGQAKYSSEYLSNPNSLDFIWIVLRNIGIFYEKNPDSFESVKKMILDNYKTTNLTSQHILNLLYILSYIQIVKIGVNQLMDQDDYLHFLICTSSSASVLMSNTQNETLTHQKLSEHLMTYIFQLISLGRSEYLYYMCLMPRSHIVGELSSIISTSQLVNVVNWDFLKQHLPLEIYQRMVKETLNKYIKMTSDYILVADKYNELLKDKEQAVKTLLQMLIKASLSSGFLQYSIKNAQEFVQKMLNFDKGLQQNYQRTTKFLIQNRILVQLISQRNDHKLYQMISGTDFIILDGIVRLKNKTMFQNLISMNGFEVYFIYLKNIIRAVQICMLRRNKNTQLKQFFHKLYNSLKEILKMERYNRFNSKQVVANVMNTLRESLYEVELYN